MGGFEPPPSTPRSDVSLTTFSGMSLTTQPGGPQVIVIMKR